MTVGRYYIFSRFMEYGIIFCSAEWIKKSAVLLLVMAIYYKKRSCADAIKYVLPFVVLTSIIFIGGYFDIQPPQDNSDQLIYNKVNCIISRNQHIALYFISSALMVICSLLLIARDGVKVKAKSFLYLPLSIILCIPLNFGENFFDINSIDKSSLLWFKSFSIWHLIAVLFLIGSTILTYQLLKRKSKEDAHVYLCALATLLLIQYHSRYSMTMGDGYGKYHTLFDCIPLYICNIGTYVVCLGIYLQKRALYVLSFIIHAAGAISVFVYFGNDNVSNFGIIFSYTFLNFTFVHCTLFVLSVMPFMLKEYVFRKKDFILALSYYFVVIITASIASSLVTSLSTLWNIDGVYLTTPLYPNYAFTQINPLPLDVPPLLTFTVWKYQVNLLYVLGLYAVYVLIFIAFSSIFVGVNKLYKKRAVTE